MVTYFTPPKSLPCCQKKMFANNLAVKNKILVIALLSEENFTNSKNEAMIQGCKISRHKI